MSVILSLALKIQGPQKNLDDFWMQLNPNNEPLSDSHFNALSINQKNLMGGSINGYEAEKSEKQIIISWDGGFGGFQNEEMFQDSGIFLSELFPELEFTLYYDGHGTQFAGEYGNEQYLEDDKNSIENVYAGGVRYRAGVRVGEKTLNDQEYFLQNFDQNKDLNSPNLTEPDYENNPHKIDLAIQHGNLRPSTILNRGEWEKDVVKNDSAFLFVREFWKEVPLIHTPAEYIDEKIASSAFAQSKHSIIFIPEQLITNEMRSTLSDNNLLLRYFSLNPKSQKDELMEFGMALLSTLTISLIISEPVNRLIIENPSAYDGTNEEIFTKAWLSARMKALYALDDVCKEMLSKLSKSIESGDVQSFKKSLRSSIRHFCGSKFDS